LSEAEHFHKCKACGGWLDMRDLGAVLDHEQALPHPASDQVEWLKKSGPGFPRPDLIRRAVYIRPRCHLNLYCQGDRRCQTGRHRAAGSTERAVSAFGAADASIVPGAIEGHNGATLGGYVALLRFP
jgi:hypothetical protein